MKQLEHVPVTDEQRAAIIDMAHQQKMNRAELWRTMAEYFFDAHGAVWPEFTDERRKESEGTK